MLDFETCDKARRSRDPAFDGLFFTAVRTTGIYCRPVCPVKQPLTRNVSYFPTAAAAERAGYRPCLRCRPETAPFCPAWKGTRTTVERAVRIIEAGALDSGSVEALAGALGIGTRHLARLFAQHIGATPLQMAQTFRIGRAKRLLDNTTLSLTEIAFQAGFGSVRSFNAAFRKLYGCPPPRCAGHGKARHRLDPAISALPATDFRYSGKNPAIVESRHREAGRMSDTTLEKQAERIRESFARQSLMATFGAEVEAVSPGRCRITAPILPLARQQHGVGHAGLTFALGDSAAGYAALTLLPEGQEVMTAEIKINLLAPAAGERLEATGEVVKAGKRLIVVRAEVEAITGGQRKTVAILQGTMISVAP